MKILIVKTSSLGDIIQAFPVVSFLKTHFPEGVIDWVVEEEFLSLLASHPDINVPIPVALRKWKKAPFKARKEVGGQIKRLREMHYDMAFDLQGNIKSGLITKLARAKEKVGMSFSSAAEWPGSLFLTRRFSLDRSLPMAEQYLTLVSSAFDRPHPFEAQALKLMISPEEEVWIAAQLYGEYRVMVCIGSQWENKRLFPSMWALLLKQLDEKKGVHFYFVWGSEKEKQEGRELHRQFKECSTLLPKLSLPVWQRMMGEMDLILSVDSSALHLAGASGVPTASFFGPSSAAVYKPPGKNHLAYQGACPYGQTFTKRCPFLRTCPSGACLKAQPPKELLDFMKQVGADRS